MNMKLYKVAYEAEQNHKPAQTVIILDGKEKSIDNAELKRIWSKVKGFENYEVNPVQGVRNAQTQKVLKGRCWYGYPKVTLMKDKKKNEVRIHRLIAETYLPKSNPNHNVVNHKDGIRSNYALHNLEWMDQSANMKDRWANAGKRPKYTKEY